MSIDARLIHLGIHLPPTPAPGGIYTPVVVIDKMAYVSGQVPYEMCIRDRIRTLD